jgi:hypothetical protein
MPSAISGRYSILVPCFGLALVAEPPRKGLRLGAFGDPCGAPVAGHAGAGQTRVRCADGVRPGTLAFQYDEFEVGKADGSANGNRTPHLADVARCGRAKSFVFGLGRPADAAPKALRSADVVDEWLTGFAENGLAYAASGDT